MILVSYHNQLLSTMISKLEPRSSGQKPKWTRGPGELSLPHLVKLFLATTSSSWRADCSTEQEAVLTIFLMKFMRQHPLIRVSAARRWALIWARPNVWVENCPCLVNVDVKIIAATRNGVKKIYSYVIETRTKVKQKIVKIIFFATS